MSYLPWALSNPQPCVHVGCGGTGCRLDALGPLLPRDVRDREGRLWQRFGDLFYRYDGNKPIDCCSWAWLLREHGPIQTFVAVSS